MKFRMAPAVTKATGSGRRVTSFTRGARILWIGQRAVATMGD